MSYYLQLPVEMRNPLLEVGQQACHSNKRSGKMVDGI